MTKAAAAKAQFWNALSDDEFDRYERRQRFIAHFTGTVTHRQAAVLGVLAEECAKHGQCTLSVGKLADAAFVTNATVRRALHAARTLGLIEMPEDVIRIVSPEWQALLQAEKGRR
jgi:hypothetical protein